MQMHRFIRKGRMSVEQIEALSSPFTLSVHYNKPILCKHAVIRSRKARCAWARRAGLSANTFKLSLGHQAYKTDE
jgi:hypothetical protein